MAPGVPRAVLAFAVGLVEGLLADQRAVGARLHAVSGGILDAVYLRPVQRADLDSVVIRPELSCARCAATIYEQATVRNLTSRTQRVKLAGRYGDHRLNFGGAAIPPGGVWTPTATVRIGHPQR